MDTEAYTLLFAVLAVVAQAITVVCVVAAATGRWAKLRARLGPFSLWAAFAVAATCMLGSLYLSEIADYPPCRLCWFQRIAMYPLVPLLGVAAVRRDQNIRLYGIVLAGLGSIISMWHMLVERYPNLEGSSCDPMNPCSIIWFERFGYLTIPTMALSGFAAIIAMLAVSPTATSTRSPSPNSEEEH